MSWIRGSIRAVTFDVGHTLIEPLEPVGAVYAAAAARHGGAKLCRQELERRFRIALHQAGSAVNTRSDWERIVDETFAGLLPLPPSQTFFPELFERFARAAAWRIYDDVRPTLEALAERGLRLGVISNWDNRLRQLLMELGLAKRFDVIVVSCEVGHAKPAREIFSVAASGLGLPAAEILHVGDNWSADVEGARVVGFEALQVMRGTPSRDGRISSLLELAELPSFRPR